MRRPKYIISWIIIGLTFPLLAVLTVNQFNWLQELQKRDRDRITRGMVTAVDKFSLKLQDEILYPVMITRMRPTTIAEIDEMFAERFFFWKNYAQNSALVRNIYLVDGQTGKARIWDKDHFAPTEAPPTVVTWNKALNEERLPEKFQETDTDIYLTEPAFNFGNEPYFFIYDLDKLFILENLIPAIAKSNLDATDLYAYRIVDIRNGNMLYTSLSRYRDSIFATPDFESPVIITNRTNRPPQETESLTQKQPRSPIGNFPPDARYDQTAPDVGQKDTLGGNQNVQRPQPPEAKQMIPGMGPNQQMQNQPQFLAMKHGIPSDFLTSVRIQVINRDGSLAELSARATWQNALISFGILAILLLGMIMLAEASRRAKELATSQQEFIATITHELKTPLAVISSAAQNLSDGLVRDQAKTKQYGEMINKEASRLAISVEHFLLYSNTSTMTRMKPVLCEVAELIQTALKFTEDDRAKYGFNTEVDLPEEPIYILGDRIALDSVFQNLAQNVLRHAADGKYLGIFVSAEEKQSGKKSVIIKIKDKGPGISQWEQKTIFEPFVRGRRAIDNQIPGNGIGLNLVKRIVTVHGGTISLESRLGMGSTFTIVFPENRGDTDVYQDSDDRR